METRFVQVNWAQSPKKSGQPCGDVIAVQRFVNTTVVAVCDGMGSGIHAHIAAQLCVSRFMELLQCGFSFREAFSKVIHTMNQAKGVDSTYAVLTAAQVFVDGHATILSYEMPAPILVSHGYIGLLSQNTYVMSGEVICESEFRLIPGAGVYLMSDGVTQAGLGNGLPFGWKSEGVCRFLRQVPSPVGQEGCEGILSQSLALSGDRFGDDTTVAFISLRQGKSLTLLTGPASVRAKGAEMIQKFAELPGRKVVCGATTSSIYARESKVSVGLSSVQAVPNEPPSYQIPGIHLATEGAVILNQVVRVLNENYQELPEQSSVRTLCSYLHEADAIHIVIGDGENTGHQSILFRQMGVMPRSSTVMRLVDLLKAMGKSVAIFRF